MSKSKKRLFNDGQTRQSIQTNQDVIGTGSERIYLSSVNERYFKFVDSGELKNIRAIQDSICRDLALKINNDPLNCTKLLYYQKVVLYWFQSSLIRGFIKKNSSRKLALGIPKLWRRYFENYGYVISNPRSNFKLIRFLLFRMIKSLVLVIILMVPRRRNLKIDTLLKYRKQGYKIVLLNSNINTKYIFDFQNQDLNCFTNWFKKFSKTDKIIFIHQIKALRYNTDVTHIYLDYRKVPVKEYGIFLKKSLKIISCAFVGIFQGNIYDFFCIADLVEDCRSKFVNDEVVPDVAIFTESNLILRPLYTYSFEKRGCSVEVFNFSNSDTVKLNDERMDLYPWLLDSWSIKNVYDEASSKILGSSLLLKSNKLVNVIGMIPDYTDTSFDLPKNGLKNLSLFDISPPINHFGITTLNDIHTSNPVAWRNFLMVFLELAHELNFNVLYKPKRMLKHKAHREFLDKLNEKQNFFFINPNVSPRSVLKNSFACVSMAVTTPAFIAKDMDIPSVFFSEKVHMIEQSQNLRGLGVVSSKSEAFEWLSNKL
jgi:hypothetical protein